MVNKANGRLFRRKDGKYLLYIPVDLAEDSMFPFKATTANPKVRAVKPHKSFIYIFVQQSLYETVISKNTDG